MAARFLYLTGPLYNSLARCAIAPIPSDASSVYPVAGLFDRYVENPFVFGSAGANPLIPIDLNMVLNGSMALNSGGKVTLWTEADTGTGAVSYSAAGGPTGGPAASFASGTGLATLLQNILCRPGERLTLRCSLKGDGTHAINVQIQNQLDLTYLTPGGLWQTAPANVFTQTAASWVTNNQLAFSVPGYASLLWPVLGYVPIRVTIAATASAAGCLATNCFLWPSSSWVSLHGYDSQPQLTLAFNKGGSADAGPSYTLQSALTIKRPAFYYATAAGVVIDDRFLQLAWTGTPSAAPSIGEAVVGQYSTLVSGFNYGARVTRMLDQVRTKGTYGATRARQLGQQERRIFNAHQTDFTVAAFNDFLENVMRVSGYGRDPIVFAPADGVLGAGDVIHGQLPTNVDPTLSPVNVLDRDTQILEDPFPTFVA